MKTTSRMVGCRLFGIAAMIVVAITLTGPAIATDTDASRRHEWDELPPIPVPLGLSGAFAGVHGNALIVAGGTNFAKPLWENDKVWHDRIFVLTHDDDGYQWHDGGRLPRPLAYGGSVSTESGLLCIGGNDETDTYPDVFMLSWDAESKQVTVSVKNYPSLPEPCAFGAAALIGKQVFLAGGQTGASLESATSNLWSLDLSQTESGQPVSNPTQWQALPSLPAPGRALNLTVHQHNGYHDCVYVISGRRQNGASIELLRDVWEFTPAKGQWRQRADLPRCVMAGTAAPVGQSHLFVLGGDDGTNFFRTEELKENHPGFIKQSLAYHTITDTWIEAGAIPMNLVTTTAVRWGNDIIIPGGEVRPRERSPRVFRVSPVAATPDFGAVNYMVLIGYLLAMVGVGFYFTKGNHNTNDFFRGGKHIPWWAAGCSIFATMLSSLTYTGIPSKAFTQDWVYAVGNLTIPLVAPLAVFVALPFYRRIDATSAYEYLEKRFSCGVRLFGSASFTLFHLFRMAVVMSLTGLALAVATPLTPTQSVLLMGGLSIIYCTLGGIEAVIWTDTIQTVVLLGGAVLAIVVLMIGIEGSDRNLFSPAVDAGKFRIANLHWDATSTQIALWVIVLGAVGQNVSSYTADQAVVQRYMTTSDAARAAKSIWVNAILTIPSTILFFTIGTLLFVFYQAHPEKLETTITADQVFPMFIAREMPIGIAGLMVAGIFAAAQSTVSTSMNSTSTTIVTDFMRRFDWCESEKAYLNAARFWTLVVGLIGTGLGLLFVNPDIKSLFDTFVMVIGLFMGVLGGLFILGVFSTTANATGALVGALVGSSVMFSVWAGTSINGYLYTTIGIVTCVVVGWLSSHVVGTAPKALQGLTIHTPKFES
ncbi:sodium:solute symporter family transporter [Neorhodopirellula pilleata]|uniref:sodium:solute symporter family transporter n=1 Tax=Neorhodopirellula pilleata TaxID=2714738 RepID=UPI0028F418B6|nr:sodium/solute symporter [Neorhodopirellula pilleata]